MELSDVYANNVKRSSIPSSIGSISNSHNFPTIEKDPTIKKLENDVFSQMAELDKKDNPIPDPVIENPFQIKTFSFEDAIKELHSMIKKDK
jgi:hypothetical protein